MTAPAIRVAGLCKGFRGHLVLEELTFEVPQGRVTAFLGGNGAGKTTTLRCVLGLLRPDAGEVELFGRSLDGPGPSPLGRLGALVETPVLYGHLTGLENLDLDRKLLGLPRGAVSKALESVDLLQDQHRLVKEYSLGMRQRLGVARALLGEPELLILDEPINGLDPSGIRSFRRLLQDQAAQGRTVFLSSHLLAEVEHVAQQVVVLEKGRCRYQGSLADLSTSGSVALGVDPPEAARRFLQQRGWIARTLDESNLRVECGDRTDLRKAAADLAALLHEGGFRLHYLEPLRADLETAFFGLTDESQPGAPGS